MRIGVPTELKTREYRVALSPAGAHELVRHGHAVIVEAGAGTGSGIADDDYRAAGARVSTADEVWDTTAMVLKVKEPTRAEYGRLRTGLVLFCYLHLAAEPALTRSLLGAGTTAIAYETVQDAAGALPLLAPMSEIAGRLAVQVGGHLLTRPEGGRGVLLSGVPGVPGGRVVVLGAGRAGQNAARQAALAGADTTVLDLSMARLREVDDRFSGRVRTIASNTFEIETALLDADLVVGAVLVPGARAPRLVDHELVARMRPGSVVVDVSVDQGGCFADTHPTSHDDPTFAVEGTTFYCVSNMPGAVPGTATRALTNATLPWVLKIAETGWRRAVRDDAALAAGLNVADGVIVHAGVAAAHPDAPREELGRYLARSVPMVATG